MQEWNVVVNVNERGFEKAFPVLREFGQVSKTGYFNVLAMKVEDIPHMLETLRERSSADPDYLSFLSRLVPVTAVFTFQTSGEFENKAKEIVLTWVPVLAQKNFHVRIYRRGFKGKLSSPEEERFLDHVLLEALEKAGSSGRITFDDPDIIIVIETIAQRAGLSLWNREDRERYPFIRLD